LVAEEGAVAAKKSAEKMAGKVFVVTRDNWRRRDAGWRRGEGEFRLATFDTPERAEADRARRQGQARLRVNPFECGPVAELSSWPEAVLLDWVQDAGLTPPEPKEGKRDWAAWWQGVAPRAAADQLLKVWEALDRVCFYRVAERPAGPVGHVLLGAYFQSTDTLFRNQCLYLEDEGGEVLAVYRTREGAELAGRQMKQRLGGDRRRWLPSGIDPLDPEAVWRWVIQGSPLTDVVEVELSGVGAKARAIHLVVRRVLHEGYPGGDEYVPIRGFGDVAAAQACRRELDLDFLSRHDLHALVVEWLGDRDFLAAAGRVRLPGVEGAVDGLSWWREHGAGLSAEQRLTFCSALDCVIHEVIEPELRD
jgi:hypothetical protein